MNLSVPELVRIDLTGEKELSGSNLFECVFLTPRFKPMCLSQTQTLIGGNTAANDSKAPQPAESVSQDSMFNCDKTLFLKWISVS